MNRTMPITDYHDYSTYYRLHQGNKYNYFKYIGIVVEIFI